MDKLRRWMNMSYREWLEYRRFRMTFPRIKIKEIEIPIYPGDFVEVLKGQEKGKSGKVLAVFRSLNWIYVRGLNLKTEGFRDSENEERFLRQERPFLTDEVMLMEPDNKGMPTSVSIGVTPEGNRVRISKNTGKVILYPREGDPNLVGAYAYRPAYVDGAYDTKAEDVLQKTYKPTLHTLEEDVVLAYKGKIGEVLRTTGWKDVPGRIIPPLIPKIKLVQFPLPYLEVVKMKPKKREGTKKSKIFSRKVPISL